MNFDVVVLVVLVFFVAGTIKGLIGFGLPTVSIAILATFLGLIEAMTLMLLPSLITNLFQGLAGKYLIRLIGRYWSLFILGAVFTWLSSSLLSTGHAATFAVILGVVLTLYGLSSLYSLQLPSPGSRERWISPLVGMVSGGITGITGIFLVPAVGYLQALRMERDELIQAIGLWVTIATISLAFSLKDHGLFSNELGLLSLTGVLPALLGMWVGRVLRPRLSESAFRHLFFAALILLGVYISVSTIVTS
ncbi:MAG TPA: sulfite exporter TauE/SafE family protein [Gammaproteobacteria bacterium]|nr:sulfite exporter TauE/SafE family protein [Gammaproteobacteria bacterium]